MRIHIQNQPSMFGEPITEAEWQAAAERANLGDRHHVTLGHDMEDFAANIGEVEALVSGTRGTQDLFPVEAPKLKVLFCTSAGLDPVPFDSIPSHVHVLNNRGVHAPKAGEYGIMALLMLANQIPALVTSQQAGKWDRRSSTLLAGRNVTVVGLGSLGGAIAGAGGPFRHAGHRRARPPRRAPGLRARAADVGARQRAAADRVPGARLPADRAEPATSSTAAALGCCGRVRAW